MKKVIATVLTAMLSLSLLSGCGSNANNSEGTANEAEKAAVTFPLAAKTEFDVHYHARDKYVFNESWPVFQKLGELTNVYLKNTANEVATNSTEQFQLQAVDGFPADIYGGNSLAQYFIQYGQEGAFKAINEYWDYAPNFRKFLDEHKDIEAAITAPDGNIYYIPYVVDGDVSRTYFMRTDWLDKLGLEVPDTVEDLEKVLIAFRDEDPNGNGEKDEIPYFNDKWQEMLRLSNLWGARVYGNDSYDEHFIPDDNDKLYNSLVQPEFKVAVENISRWYDEGLIDQEIFTKGSSSRKEYLPTNVGGMTHEWVASTSGYNDKVDVEGFKFEGIIPPTGTNGEKWEEHERIPVKPDGWAISSNCDDVATAIAYLDYMWTEEGRILTNFGVEGVSYTMVDGKPVFTDEVLNGEKAVNAYLEEDMGAQLKGGYWQDYNYELQWTNAIGQDVVSKYTGGKYSVKQLPPFQFTTEGQAIVDKYLSNINAYMEETIQSWILGDYKDIDAQWDKYVATLDEMGLQELQAAYQEGYDNYLKIAE
ncbi:hypothetical protein [Clostridium grantii]|uniref:Putative aldouronate transport system substrate-binding protein n=1 Tax=Clostridium grantii DSM 8605 TaxID=1121316 RepID=A0A1M5UWE4_9CLOT|nr:hypothetical protein [Clostridium grantii]SHH67043.1 putative aldouronate transport system substrate-binding protein [Clostridium grantii DSM 8605]